jgi:hypothetical protein
MSTEMERLDKHRREVRTRSGLTSYVDTGGSGRPALFVHGLATSCSYCLDHPGVTRGRRSGEAQR